MPTVTINGTAREVYVSLADAELYLEASPRFTAWGVLTAERKAQWIVEATRMFERCTWTGDRAATAQPLAWPRSGVTDRDGEDVVDDAIPTFMEDGCAELAATLAEDAAVVTAGSTASNVKSVNAKGVAVEFFAPDSGTRFPTVVQELVGFYLAAPASESGGVVGAIATGTCHDSQFEDCDDYETTVP